MIRIGNIHVTQEMKMRQTREMYRTFGAAGTARKNTEGNPQPLLLHLIALYYMRRNMCIYLYISTYVQIYDELLPLWLIVKALVHYCYYYYYYFVLTEYFPAFSYHELFDYVIVI